MREMVVCLGLGDKKNEADLEDLLAQIDQDGSGLVDFDEFFDWYVRSSWWWRSTTAERSRRIHRSCRGSNDMQASSSRVTG